VHNVGGYEEISISQQFPAHDEKCLWRLRLKSYLRFQFRRTILKNLLCFCNTKPWSVNILPWPTGWETLLYGIEKSSSLDLIFFFRFGFGFICGWCHNGGMFSPFWQSLPGPGRQHNELFFWFKFVSRVIPRGYGTDFGDENVESNPLHSSGDSPRARHSCCCRQMNWWVVLAAGRIVCLLEMPCIPTKLNSGV